MRSNPEPILVINSGSSSLKAALFLPEKGGGEQRMMEANATGIGQAEGKLTITGADGNALAHDKHDYKSQPEALDAVAQNLRQHFGREPGAIGHRIVHGGMHLTTHQRITPEVLTQLHQAVHFAPLHIPGSLELIHKAQAFYPGVPEFACFDTAFHQTLPEYAWRIPIADEYAEAGMRRYGFHGLSYESIVAQLRAGGAAVPERVIVAHLGSGSSLAAIANGRSIDTSMGLTPAGGIPMATRTGDLDPGILIFLMRASRLSLDEAEAVVNRRGGLAALSGGISDMQKLEAAAAQKDDQAEKAALAIDIFARAIAKTVASYIVSLGGLDLFVFTGGIGEHSASLRARAVSYLGPLGFQLDAEANAQHGKVISAAGSRVAIRILPAQEDLQIARHVRRLLADAPAS